MFFTVDLIAPLRAAPLSSSSSSMDAAATASYRRALIDAKAVLPWMERSLSHNSQRSKAPGSLPASDVPDGLVGRGKNSSAPMPPVQERLRNSMIQQEKLRGQPHHQAGEEAGLSPTRA